MSVTPERALRIPFTNFTLEGDLTVPEGAFGLVIFAHGSGSSRFSPRNRYVARLLNKHKLAALLVDLLTPEEEKIDNITGHLRFNVDLLAGRLCGVTTHMSRQPDTQHLGIGYFGASTGAAAALIAAALCQEEVRAVVSRGGRPDLAGEALSQVRAPTLLIVGGEDRQVIELNRKALIDLTCEVELVIVPGASHLFEEPGALDQVAHLASDWFLRHLATAATPSGAATGA